jgi:hypothetical protein
MAGDKGKERRQDIKIATYNILSGRNGRLEMALRELDRLNVDLCFLTEAKLTGGIYTRSGFGYKVFATEAASPNKGGVALIWRDKPNLSLESEKAHGPNVISCEVKTGHKRFLLVGAYISPSETDGSTTHQIEQAVTGRPGLRTLVMGDFNVDLTEPSLDARDTAIHALFAGLGVFNMADHFIFSRAHREGYTWKHVRNGELLTSRCNSILSNCPRDFTNIQIRSPRGQLSDHDALCGWLRAGSKHTHKGYLNARRSIPWSLPAEPSDGDVLVACLVENRTAKPPTRRAKKPWVSDATWRLVDQRAELKRRDTPSEVLKEVNDKIHRSLKRDRKTRVTDAGAEIEAALDSDDLQLAWDIAKGWYRNASPRAPKPSNRDFKQLNQERALLYTAEQPPGESIPIRLDSPFTIDDSPQHWRR